MYARFKKLRWRSGLGKTMELSERMLVEGYITYNVVVEGWR